MAPTTQKKAAQPSATSAELGYAGDLSPRAAWERLQTNPQAQMIDVRTPAEWAFVGQADLSALGRELICLTWEINPDQKDDKSFGAKLSAIKLDKNSDLLFICRSGQRSRASARAATQEGFHNAYNIEHGFEGDLDSEHHRGRANGWKHDGLPWRQP